MIFSVVDVETTGGNPDYASITEIAIVKTDGAKILDTFESLVNPESSIPAGISRLTGITNEMVAGQPVFEKLSHDIQEFLKDTVFVAHNVHFDYGFIREGMKKSGKKMELDMLCSVQYTRRVFPGLSSYSLGSICNHFGISNRARHRAMGDARATAELLHILMHHDQGLKYLKQLLKRSALLVLPGNVHTGLFDTLPHSTGVYRFLNHAGKPIYIGKAKDIKSRIRQHFTENGRNKFNRFRRNEIYDINWTETGSETVAMILEDNDIRKHWPIYNKAQKFQSGHYRIIYYLDRSGNFRLGIQTGAHKNEVLLAFDSMTSARNQLIQIVKEHRLHPALCNVFNPSLSEVTLNEHNQRCEILIESLTGNTPDLFLLDKGRDHNEVSIILVRNRKCIGFTFINFDQKINAEYIENNLIPVQHSTNIQWIIQSYVLRNPERCKTKSEIEAKALIL